MLNNIGTCDLETERIVLRKYYYSDAEDMYENWVANPEACRFWKWEPHKNIDETKLLLSKWIDEYEKINYFHWVIVLKNTLQAIGYIYFSDLDDKKNSISSIMR